jgi:iron complex outermembrane receptor protein
LTTFNTVVFRDQHFHVGGGKGRAFQEIGLMKFIQSLILGSVVSLGVNNSAFAESSGEAETLSSLSIEDLSKITVTSVSKRPQPLSEAPAAIYVMNSSEIARSTAASLPELLVSIPNLQAQRINSYEYAITARGFNSYDSSNKLLAQIDGRSIYTPLFSGIFWEQHSPVIEDIDQIEVVSGPGGTLYGPNAVNGVISIVTKDARDTVGGFARATVATNQQTIALRYGAPLGFNSAIRAYVNYYNRGDMPGAAQSRQDRYNGFQTGFRADAGLGSSSLTIQGDLFRNHGWLLNKRSNEAGQNILAKVVTPVGDGSLQIQGYYDFAEQRVDGLVNRLGTFDLTTQYSLLSGRHALVVGLGARTTDDLYVNTIEGFKLIPDSQRLWVFNAYVQDRFALTNHLSVTAGVKIERSSFSGLEVLPNLRIAFQPNDDTLLWAAVSQGVRTPSRADRHFLCY